jgi:fimbrial isopeptide formation D2 family protein/LPXTG-motif cell wall-anchored protein
MLKKILALALAGAMVIGSMSLTSFAATTDTQIMITNLEDGDTVNFYQILEWKDAEGAYAGWSLVAPFTGIVDSSIPELADEATAIKTMVGDPLGNPAVLMKLTSDIAGKLAKLSKTATAKPGTVNGTTATLDIDGTTNTIGMYMAIVTPKDADTVYNPVFVSADFQVPGSYNPPSSTWEIKTSEASYYNNGAAKRSKVGIDKKAKVDAGTSYDPTWMSTRIGERVDYTVETTIPGYGKIYESPSFVMKDIMTDLELDTDTVKLVEPAGAVKDQDYTIQATTAGYTITFDPAYLLTISTPTQVVVEYTATVSTKAKQNVNIEKNEVWVEFTHNSQDESDFKVKKDDTIHYTFTIDANTIGDGVEAFGKSGSEFVKIGKDASGNVITSTRYYSQVTTTNFWEGSLAECEFRLLDADKQPYKDGNGNALGTIKSGSDGRLYVDGAETAGIYGLDAGVYYLEEISAPNGFIKAQELVKFEIKAYYEDIPVTEYYDVDTKEWKTESDKATDKEASYVIENGRLIKYEVWVDDVLNDVHTFYNEGKKKAIRWSDEGSKELPCSIVNFQGVELPSTGGIGTTIFYMGGGLLVVLAGILLVSKRRVA